MIGALTGDIVGSIYEFDNIKTTAFPLFQESCRFTDDTVLTVALADSLLSGENYEEVMRKYYFRYPAAGYGGIFRRWARREIEGPYQSWGNGSAMRTSPVGWAFNSLQEVLEKAEEYAAITHDHPEGIKGAQAAAAAIFLGRTGASKDDIRRYVNTAFGYDVSRSCDQIRPAYRFDVSCQETLPPAITAFLESTDFESALRLAVSLGGDTDTLTCITGGIAEAFYGGVPQSICRQTMDFLDEHLRSVTEKFVTHFGVPSCW
ncbi:MAG: ADP-ribosylglycohydrolase family protein [Deltaproteobacteria bacterium]|nr:ADP-ribosylglycohydrolase family protein [Deltaproteobacteria bacterium]